jgi:hypothetical protein
MGVERHGWHGFRPLEGRARPGERRLTAYLYINQVYSVHIDALGLYQTCLSLIALLTRGPA